MKETLSGDNQYRCEGCNKLRDAERYTEIVQLPPVRTFVGVAETSDRRWRGFQIDACADLRLTTGIALFSNALRV